MRLSSLQLEAFLAVARKGGFTSAAQSLHITQSALSQRVLKLEEELQATLIIRDPAGLKLTSQGEQLLRFCEQQERLEGELLGKLAPGASGKPGKAAAGLSGALRVAGFSTVMESIVMPALTELMLANPSVRLELRVAELRELPKLLQSGEADFVLLDREVRREGVVARKIGEETYVWVQPALKTWRKGVFLDHDAEDETTEEFFRLQGGKPPGLERSFLGGISAIIQGVSLGWGEAVVPKHLIEGRKDLRAVPGKKPMVTPIYLNYFEQAFPTELQTQALVRLKAM
jgi:DNA-binding transcriptional LysR family regulator